MIRGLDFVALDVETANSRRGSICSIGIAVVHNGEVTDVQSWLCRPPDGLGNFNPFNISIHGITSETVAAEPTFSEQFDQALDIIGNLPIVAHNAAFDVGAIRDAYNSEGRVWPSLRYGCTLIWSRRLLTLISYTLPMVADSLGISFIDHHNAGADALAAAQVTVLLASRLGAHSVSELATDTETVLGSMSPDLWAGCQSTKGDNSGRSLPTLNRLADPSNALFGQVVVFTGGLFSMVRSDAHTQVALRGGKPEAGVNKFTTRLVIGDGFTGSGPNEFVSGKAAKAVAWLVKGHDIQVLTELEFLAALTDVAASGVRPGVCEPDR